MNINEAKILLKDYEQDLEFEEAFGFILVKFKAFVSKDRFDKVYALVREAGGEYVSAGKKSHFRLRKDPKTEARAAPAPKGPEPPTPQPQKPAGRMTQTKMMLTLRGRLELLKDEINSVLKAMDREGYKAA